MKTGYIIVWFSTTSLNLTNWCLGPSSYCLEPSAALLHHVGNSFQEVFQMKHGCYADIPAARISEVINSTRFDVCLISLIYILCWSTVAICYLSICVILRWCFFDTFLWVQNAPTQSLLSAVNGILDEGNQRKNGEIPYVSKQASMNILTK